jgi:hypothetical protein
LLQLEEAGTHMQDYHFSQPDVMEYVPSIPEQVTRHGIKSYLIREKFKLHYSLFLTMKFDV